MTEIIEANLALPAHADALRLLMNDYALDPMGGGQALATEVLDRLPAALRRQPGAHVILALVDGEAAGVAVCFEGFSTFACRPLLNIHDFAVAARHRGCGVARLLLQRAETIAHRLDCCKLTLEVLEGNRVAQAVYRKSGFAAYRLDPQMGQAQFWEKKLG